MDIQANYPQISRNQNQNYKSLVVLLQKELFNLPKALKLSEKYPNHQQLCISLLDLCRQDTSIRLRLNIIKFLVSYFRTVELKQNFNAQFTKRIIMQVYEMRWKMELQNNHDPKNQLQILNGLIKIIKKLIQKIRNEFSLLNYMRKTIYQCENTNFFTTLNNILFSLKLLLLLDKNETYQQALFQAEMAGYYLARLLEFNVNTLQTQQIITIAFLNCTQKYQTLASKLQEFINKSSFYQKLIIMNERLPEERCLQFLKLNLCQNQQQLQLITQIVSNKFPDAWPSLKRQLCIFWLINCNKLLQVDQLFDLSHYISNLQPQISSQMALLLNTELNQQQKQLMNRKNVLHMWSKFLLDPKVLEQVQLQKPLFIATELLFYRFIREILSQIENSLNEFQMQIILETFSKYFSYFLQQQECEPLRKKITRVYIQHYAHFLTPFFLIKCKQNYKDYSTQITNLSIFDPELLELLLAYVESGKQKLLDLLGRLQNEVSVIVLKYITQKNQWEYNELFSVNQIVQYLFENNIQVHVDKFEYQFYKKVSQNIEKYMKIIRKSTHQNRYQRSLNQYIVDLLENQLLNQAGLKKIPVSLTTIMYIVQRFQDIFNIAQIKGNCLPKMINYLYALANRSLFANIPDAYYLLILAIAHLKQFTDLTFYDSETIVLQNLIKFIKHYETHNAYLFFGFASLLVVLYGLPEQERKMIAYSDLCQQVIVGPFLLQNIGKLLNFKHEGVINRKPEQIEVAISQRTDLITRKIIIYNILRKIHILALKGGLQNNNQAVYLQNLVQKLIDAQIEIQKPSNKMEIESQLTTKKRTKYLFDQEEISYKPIKKQSNIVKDSQRRPNSLQKLFNKLQNYDEFKYFRMIIHMLRGNVLHNTISKDSHQYAKLQRVDGKVRTIFHVKK